jgi:ABC-2 type transport system ATP-binding protein
MDIFQAINIEKQFVNHKALNKVSINVPEGKIFGLLGPNGAGKTTLIRIINQITAPDSGDLLFKGRPLQNDDVLKIGYLPEERGLYKKMKVGEQAIYLARLKGLSRHDAITKLKYWFTKFGIEPWWNKKVEELSKGMQQKIQFVVTILHEPELLIFDEPFSGFDPINTKLLKEEILNLKEKGSTIIFSTHNMASVEEVCDNIALINQSEKILDGAVTEIKRQFKNNTFECVYRGNFDTVTNIIKDKLNIIEHIKKDENIYLKAELNEFKTNNNLLNTLLPEIELIAFNEVMPTMDDIFIKVVKEDTVINN